MLLKINWLTDQLTGLTSLHAWLPLKKPLFIAALVNHDPSLTWPEQSNSLVIWILFSISFSAYFMDLLMDLAFIADSCVQEGLNEEPVDVLGKR